ncbi:cytochrome P450 71A1 [Jatropha curcas]|uniref:cytochrome P450 71A1 n=1 Tax=Jatropha curcas TaxID=180498 RepID=UPI0009D78742|nr:cytochrome P450 71A1 [Jatropha curcas]
MDSLTLLQQWWQEPGKTSLFCPIFFCFIILFSFLFLFKTTRNYYKLNLPPSPPKLPIIGNLHQISALPYKSFTSLSNIYGPLMLLRLGYVPTLVVSSVEMVKEITNNHDVIFADRPSLTGVGIVLNGCLDMAFGPYCDYSREVKKLCVLQLLSHKRVQQFHFIREEEVEKIVERIQRVNGAPINLSDMFTSLAHNILSRSAFGSLYEDQNGKYKSFGELARKTMNLLSAFCFKDWFPYLGWIDHLTGFIRNLKMIAEELNEFLDRVIKEREALMNDNEKVEDKNYLIDILLYLRKEEQELHLSKDNLKAVLLDMFVAGVDTTAATMEFMMAELIKNPRIMKKAQEEIRRVVGNSKSNITVSDINQMEYLKCVMKETLRFHASGAIARQTSANVKLKGYDIPAKTRVIINTWAIHMDPTLWDRPEEFLPERFLDSTDDSDGEQKNPLFSFGTGTRVCPGMSYAYAEVEYAIANLLYWFDWELPDGARVEDLDMSEVITIVIRKKTPLWVVAHSYFP